MRRREGNNHSRKAQDHPEARNFRSLLLFFFGHFQRGFHCCCAKSFQSLFILEQLHNLTSQSPETPHEKWFQSHFSKPIGDTLMHMRDPPNPSQPQSTWNSYKLLIQTLQQAVQKRVNRVNSLSMAQISPKLAAMKSTAIAMPGIQQSSGNVVTIEGLHNSVSILPTKTKPKKIVLVGSDGQRFDPTSPHPATASPT